MLCFARVALSRWPTMPFFCVAAAEPPTRRTNVRLQHRLDPIAQRQVSKSDDSGADTGGAISAAVAHGSNAGDELGFPDGPELLGSAFAVHRMALQEHRRSNVVAPAKVVEQLVQQVSMIGTLPKVMVSINNWQVRVDNYLLRRPR